MGEIVRVLKWRLDLDAAGMADGIEKAATSAEKLARSTAEIGERGTAGLKKTSAAAKETETAFEGLGLEAKQVEMFVSRLEKGAGSPLVLKRNAEQAEAAFNVLSTAAGKAGKSISDAFADRVINAISKGTTQAAAMNAELEKMGGQTPTKLDKVITALDKTAASAKGSGVAMKETALRSEQLSSGMGLIASVGGPAGMALASMASQSSATGNAMVVLAGKMALVTAAAKGGWEVGQKLDEAWKKVGFDLSDGPIDAGLKQLEERLNKTSAAAQDTTPSILGLLTGTANLDKGMANLPQKFKDAALNLAVLRDRTDEAGTSFKGLAADIALDDERLTAHTRSLQGQIVARRALLNEVDKTSGAFKAALPGWESTAEHAQKLKDQIDAVAVKFKAFSSTGAELRKEVEANQVPFAAFVAMLEKEKVALDTLPPSLQEAVRILKELQAASAAAVPGLNDLATALEGIGKGDVVTSIEAVAQALKLIGLSGGDVGAAVATNIDGLMKLRTAAEGNYEALAKFRTEVMDQIPAYQATAIAMQGYAETLEGITAATAEYEAKRRAANEADIEAGIRMAEFKAHAADMARSIDTIGEAWVKATGQAAGFSVEVRRATKAAQESTPEFDNLVESLAVVSDQYERMIPWVGALIAQLESGAIGTEEFRKQMEALQVGFMQIQGVSGQMFGDLDSLWAKLTAILNEFTRKGK